MRTHAGLSGVLALREGRDAFAVRMQLAEAAVRKLDCQYYLWRNDLSGTLLLDALLRAADRGVQVRLLLDDHNTDGLDTLLAALDAHANFAVRLFNPYKLRWWRTLGYFGDFARLNRRMHNKSFTADDELTVVGGRNVGDEYFDAHAEVAFVDLDVFAIGEVVAEVARDFDRYWNSAAALPVGRLLPEAGVEVMASFERTTTAVINSPESSAYLQSIAKAFRVAELVKGGTPALEWVLARLVSDPPEKGLRRIVPRKLLVRRLERILGVPVRELQLVSPYFVPSARGLRLLAGLARRGVRVTIVTNSLEATDVAAVHVGYARHRKRLLEAGVALYEIKREAAIRDARNHRWQGSSRSSLHAKVFCVDRARVFIGSFNFDARSMWLNTEMGLVVDSETFARPIAAAVVSEAFPAQAYAVRLDERGDLQWLEQQGEQRIVHDTEPHASVWRRATVVLLSLLPIDWLL